MPIEAQPGNTVAPGPKLHIGMLSYSLPRSGQKRGGIERVAHDLANGLARRGHRVTVWSHDPKPPGAPYTVLDLPWRRFADGWLGRRLTMGYLGNFLPLIVDAAETDVVIAHGDSLFLPLTGKPSLRILHGSAWAEARHATSMLRFLHQVGVYLGELLTALTQKHCVAVSENTTRYYPVVRHIIPNGVDLGLFHPGLNERSPEPSILFIGALDGRKRGQLLLKWFKQFVRPGFPNARLVMVTRPGPVSPGVEYFEGISQELLARLYRQAWVYASPSTYEGFGLPYVEAMASGTPVLATPNPGSREVLGNGQFGCLAADAEFPSELLALIKDRDRRQRFTAAGLVRAKVFDLETTLDKYERLLREVAGERNR